MTTILVVDDSPDDREALVRAVRRGYGESARLEEAEDIPSCLARLSEGPPVDCVLLDNQLPGHSGVNALERLFAVAPHVAVIVVTGDGDEDLAVEAIKNGAADYIAKEKISAEKLAVCIQFAIKRAQADYDLQQRQEELRLFSRLMVHDFRAPIRAVRNAIHMLEEDLPAQIRQNNAETLNFITAGAERMDRLIVALKSYTEGMATDNDFEVVDLNRIVEEVKAVLAVDLAKRNATVTVEGVLPALDGHGPQLSQLISNIIGNGIKFNQSERPCIQVSATELAEHWQIAFSDNGIGIDPSFAEKIFEPFQRLHSQRMYEGSGLGLATCRKIAERHGGTLRWEPAPGGGSTFLLQLPKAASSQALCTRGKAPHTMQSSPHMHLAPRIEER